MTNWIALEAAAHRLAGGGPAFTGTGDDPETRGIRARELLSSILESLERHAGKDATFRLLDALVSALPAGVQLFSLFQANSRLLTLISDPMGVAPRLAQNLSRHVDLLEAMLAPDFFEQLPPWSTSRLAPPSTIRPLQPG